MSNLKSLFQPHLAVTLGHVMKGRTLTTFDGASGVGIVGHSILLCLMDHELWVRALILNGQI